MLCKQCHAMFQGKEFSSPHHADLTSFTSAAEKGCYLCYPLMQQFLKKYGSTKDPVQHSWSYRVYENGPQSSYVIMDLEQGEEGAMIGDVKTHLDCYPMVAMESSTVTVNPEVRGRLSFPIEDAVVAARKWLDGCLEGHEQCVKNVEPGFYPEILLELGESTVRVISTAEEKISGPYVALSYCWRSSDASFLRLSESNIRQFQGGISRSELPTAYREAVDLVKGLSIRYLWIEALCTKPVPENTPEHNDWAQQQKTYSNCHFNLALATATHPNESSLGGCPQHAKLPFQVETTGFIGDDPSGKCTATVVPYDYFQSSLYYQPLGLRARSIQDHFSAPRVLSFGLGELFWDCTQLPNASETIPRGPCDPTEHFFCRKQSIPRTSDKEELEEFWWRVLQEYTDRELDRPEEDKLAGVSGIAGHMAVAMDDVYIYGHFLKTLPQSLDWQVYPPMLADDRLDRQGQRIIDIAKNSTSARKQRTPSWSWASMDGTVYFPRFNDCSNVAEVEGYTCNPVDSLDSSDNGAPVTLTIKTNCVEIEWLDGDSIIQHEFWGHVKKSYWHNAHLDDRSTPANGTRHLVAALFEDGWLATRECLLLKEVTIDGKECYERVGHFLIAANQGEDKRAEWKEDYKLMFEQRRVLNLV